MKSATHALLNLIDPDIKSRLSYLELGWRPRDRDEEIFEKLEGFKLKETVDIAEAEATYHMSTDVFFDQNTKKYDIIFIDAWHEFSQVVKDYNNSLKALNEGGLILFHDLYPLHDWMCSLTYCGDGYHLLNHFDIHNPDVFVYIPDHGTTCVFGNLTPVNEEDVVKISYDDFITNAAKSPKFTRDFDLWSNLILSKL